MLINCRLQDIDYSSVVLAVLKSTQIFKNTKVFLALLFRATEKLPQGVKNKVAVGICNEKHLLIEKETNRFIADNNVKLSVNNVGFKKELNEVLVQIDVSEIDYDQIIINFLPQIVSLIPKKDSTEIVFKALDIVKDERETIVRNILSSVSSEKKQELLELFLTQYNSKLCDLINSAMYKNSIIAKINEVTVVNEE